ncbi:MAG: beta-CASP ribonuclease aCPSF1 [Candidatus Micrarchaeota archaeon]|nr:beta-CASP ribonuclease aCPSF1 [Candidatus Micrarchaeota archaeon]
MELKEIERKLLELVPKECALSKIEPEGLDIVLYLKNIKKFYENEFLIKKIASSIRKRIIIRSEQSALLAKEKALEEIKQIIPPEAQVEEIRFNPEFSEVVIEALKPGLVIGKGGENIKKIIQQTGWVPRIERKPTMPSSTLKGIRASFIKEAAQRKKFLTNLGKKICLPTKKTELIKVTALGGYKEVGRSCTLFETNNSKILIDCGINPETFDAQKAYPHLSAMQLELDKIDAVILTHAHLDHSGFIPYLFAYGYDGPVYCTPPTRDLSILLQNDFINVLQKANGTKAPYGVKDIQKELSHMVVLDYGEVVDISNEIKLTFYNSGHILGSAQVHLHIGEGLHNVVFSGDIKYGFTKLLEPAETSFPRVETLFVESTYGARNDVMSSRFEADKRLIDFILKVIERKGKVLIPVFAVGRSQELMLVLEEFCSKNPSKEFKVFIDGMILEASAIHTAYPEYLKHNIQRRILTNNSPFESKIFMVAKGDRKEIVEQEEPCVILSPSGMMSGGPVLDYLKYMCQDEKNALVFVGYQSATSLGRKIQNGLKEVPVIGEDGKTSVLKINMEVTTIEGYSGHSDRSQLMKYIKNIRPPPAKIFTMHGEEDKCDDLARSAHHMIKAEARAPLDLDSFRLL